LNIVLAAGLTRLRRTSSRTPSASPVRTLPTASTPGAFAAASADARLGRRPLLGPGAREGVVALFTAVGFTLPNSGILLETAHRSLIGARRDRGHAARKPATRHPSDARAAIAAVREGATLPESRLRPLPHGRLEPADRARLRRARLRLFAPNLGTTQICSGSGLGALLVFFGVALLSSFRVVPLLATAIGWPPSGSAATRLAGSRQTRSGIRQRTAVRPRRAG